METRVLSAAIDDIEAFGQFDQYDIYNDLSDSAQTVWKHIKEYYDSDSTADHVDKEVLKTTITRVHPKHGEMFCNFIDGLEPTSSINVLKEILEQKREATMVKLSQAFAAQNSTLVEELLEQYERLIAGELDVDEGAEILIDPDLTEIMDERSTGNRITLLPKQLSAQTRGGLLPGHHIVVFGPTEMGKTLFTINLCRGFIEDGRKVLYVGNEDPISDLIVRFLMSLANKTEDAIARNPLKAREYAQKKGWGNLVWAELTPGTPTEIRALIEEHKPEVIVVDQIRNLELGQTSFVRTQEEAAKMMRNFAKRYGIAAVSIAQAADSATNKAILGRGDIDNSNVGIPGTADILLGIGATEEMEAAGIRILSLVKNKVGGDKTPIQVMFNTNVQRVE